MFIKKKEEKKKVVNSWSTKKLPSHSHGRVKRVGTHHGAERERVEPIEFEYTKTRKKERKVFFP